MKEQKQMTLDFEPGLTAKFPSPRSVVAHVAYAFGIRRMAAELDMGHGELSKVLAGDSGYGSRNLDVDLAERIMQVAGSDLLADYFIEKFKGSRRDPKDAAMSRLDALLSEVSDIKRVIEA